MNARRSPPESSGKSPQRGARRGKAPWREMLETYLAHHRKVARDSARRMVQTPVASLMTWTVMGVALALPVGLLLLLTSLQGVSAGWESAARVTVYLSDDTTLEQANRLRLELATRPDVAEIELIDKAAALAEFRASSGLSQALDYLDENPLPHTLLVTPAEAARGGVAMSNLLTSLEASPGVARVQVDLGWLQRLNAITELLGRGVWALALLLAVAVILVIGNTIRLAIESRRDEILVAKLVGGTDAFVRRPFLYTGVWFGLGGGVVAFVLLQITLWWLSGPVEQLASLYRSQFSLSGLSVEGSVLLLLTAVAFGWLGAWLAVKRHLDAIEPG
ncbi:MAG: permease-like cell division protein FtsX [Marinobacter sp.]|uniref:permease-like cell division protein FtsX n=1 Tax=Marinobacter sp. TaxID=50741 RepID=UPI00299EB12F|nr:permease-like cell division protein FtsX [Marinobacter sp.]MDX1635800.1 permease-like cell division protein FtsX [Marinobacter sp.]